MRSGIFKANQTKQRSIPFRTHCKRASLWLDQSARLGYPMPLWGRLPMLAYQPPAQRKPMMR